MHHPDTLSALARLRLEEARGARSRRSRPRTGPDDDGPPRSRATRR